MFFDGFPPINRCMGKRSSQRIQSLPAPPSDRAELIRENAPLVVNTLVHVNLNHLASDDLSGTDVITVGDSISVEAFKVDEALSDSFCLYFGGVDGSEPGMDEFVFSIGQFGGGEVDFFGDGFADDIDHKFFFPQDIEGGIFGFSGGCSDQRAEGDDHGPGADTGKEAERRQIVASVFVASGNQGNGTGKNRSNKKLVVFFEISIGIKTQHHIQLFQ